MLKNAEFKTANLTRAVLSGADAEYATFPKANCEGAKFRGTKLQYADFSHAVLVKADLSNSDLTSAKLHRAEREGARFDGATTKNMEQTDPDLAWAEDYRPPSLSK